jgi:hypothetical protein
MGLDSHSGVLRVREALKERGFEPEVVELEQTARSAAEAADALGVRVEQIVKSLVFRGRRTGRPVLVLAGGANRVDENRISRLLSEPVEMADAAYVREKTGFAIGGCRLWDTPRCPRRSWTRSCWWRVRSGPLPGTRTWSSGWSPPSWCGSLVRGWCPSGEATPENSEHANLRELRFFYSALH